MRDRKNLCFGGANNQLITMGLLRKKGQEEMVGFVVIVVLVAIVSVVLLGISFREKTPSTGRDSSEIYQFLESMMGYTTDCALQYEPDYSELSELIAECNSNSAIICTNEENVCDKAETSIKEILSSSFKVGDDRPIKGYEFEAVYSNENDIDAIFNISEGVCNGSFEGSEYISSAFPGTIVNSLKLCS